MSRKSAYLALLGAAMFMDGGQSRTLISDKEPLTPEELKLKKEAQMKAAGLKLFTIDGKEIWALNEKNAIKKYSKLNPTTLKIRNDDPRKNNN